MECMLCTKMNYQTNSKRRRKKTKNCVLNKWLPFFPLLSGTFPSFWLTLDKFRSNSQSSSHQLCEKRQHSAYYSVNDSLIRLLIHWKMWKISKLSWKKSVWENIAIYGWIISGSWQQLMCIGTVIDGENGIEK